MLLGRRRFLVGSLGAAAALSGAARAAAATQPAHRLSFFHIHTAEKLSVTYREHLVDQEDMRLEVRGNGEGEPHLHAIRVPLDRRIDERCDAGEVHNLVEPPEDVAPLHSQNGAIDEDVLAPGQLRVKTRPNLEERPHTSAHGGRAL